LQKPTKPGWQKKFSINWTGALPAFLLKSNDGLHQFYQQDFSENDLLAILQPFFL